MADEEITTKLKIVVDRTQADADVADMVQRYQAGVSAANARLGGGAGGMGGTTTSTAPGGGGLPYNPAYPGPATPGTPGGGGGGPPPGSSTTSTSGGGGGARGPGGRFVSGGGGPPSLWTDEEIHDMGRVNRVRADMSQYLRGGSLSSTARFLGNGLFAGNPLGGAISAFTTGMGDSVMEAAKARAQQIEEAKAMGLSGSQLPTMGGLAYAGPFGVAAGLVGQFAAKSISSGLDLQEQTSQWYGNQARALAMARASGAIGNETTGQFLTRAATPWNGALGRDDAIAAASSYAGVGFRDTSPLDYMRLAQTGVSNESIRSFRANARLGVGGLNQGQLEGFIGAGQAGGLAGSGLDAFLSQIAQNTRSMAMRGVRIDQSDLGRFLNRSIGAGVSPEIAAAGAASMTSNVMSLRDQALSPFKGFGDALVMMQALRGARSLEGYAGNLEDIAAQPGGIRDIIGRGGRGVVAAYQGTGIRNTALAGTGANRAPSYIDTGAGATAYEFAASTAMADVVRFGAMQSARRYEGQQAFKAGGEARDMDFGFMNEFKKAFIDQTGTFLERWGVHAEQTNRPLVDAIDKLIKRLDRL